MSQVSSFYTNHAAVLSPALLSDRELRTAHKIAMADPAVRETFATADGSARIVYVVPQAWALPDLPIEARPQHGAYGGHFTPRDFDRTRYKLLFGKARTYVSQSTGRDILASAYGLHPVTVVQIDTATEEVTRIETPPTQVYWGISRSRCFESWVPDSASAKDCRPTNSDLSGGSMSAHRLVQTTLSIMVLGLSGITHAQPPVWIDTDASLGTSFRDVDDILALLQVFGSPSLRLQGISVTFGNIDDIDRARKKLTAMTLRFGPRGLKVYPGADGPSDLGIETAASAALTQALKRERLTILALGAMTNVATVLLRHPELTDRIARVIAVAGRRPGDRFAPGKGWVTLRDLNFESDPRAFRVLLEADVPVTLIPFELGNQVWIASSDLHRMRAAGGAASWFAARAASWLDLWAHAIGVTGFNPFDSLTITYLTSPEWLKCRADVPTVIRRARDDSGWLGGLFGRTKPYLLASSRFRSPYRVEYCSGVMAGAAHKILARAVSAGAFDNRTILR